ncbi:MAG: GntR family transcriptional regulator [Eubacterium sp.]
MEAEKDKIILTLDVSSCKPLREIVFETIRNAIVIGELKPGQRLMEVQLAEQLGVSRTPVRESIRKLELEGLVKMVPRKGAYVTPMSIDDLRDMMEIRRALEALSAELAAKNATVEDIEQLKKSNKGFEESALKNDESGIIEYDIKFHETIYKATHNEKLCQMINSLREQMQRIRVEYVHHIEDKTPLIGQHQIIIENIEKHQEEEASVSASNHIKITEKDMVAVLD